MERLTAKSNDKIKLAVLLRQSAKARREKSLFFLEGARLCGDAAQGGVSVKMAFLTLTAIKKYSQCSDIITVADEVYEISDELASKLSDTENPQGVFCICRAEQGNTSLDKIRSDGKYIFLENLQDPSNLGAVSRTAEALGIDGIIVCGGCDVYNPKSLRASMGSALRISTFVCDNAVKMLTELKNRGMLTLASTPDSDSTPITDVNFDCGVVCVVGNEGNGVTDEAMAICDKKVTIPMGGRAESLNASTAAAILIWEMVRG